MERESLADCVVEVLVTAEHVEVFGVGIWVEGYVALKRKDDGYELVIEEGIDF